MKLCIKLVVIDHTNYVFSLSLMFFRNYCCYLTVFFNLQLIFTLPLFLLTIIVLHRALTTVTRAHTAASVARADQECWLTVLLLSGGELLDVCTHWLQTIVHWGCTSWHDSRTADKGHGDMWGQQRMPLWLCRNRYITLIDVQGTIMKMFLIFGRYTCFDGHGAVSPIIFLSLSNHVFRRSGLHRLCY